MDKTKIEWADSTWNPITGCRHKCPYCYARGIANRFVSRKGCHLVEPETYKLGDDGSETYEINEQPYYVDDETGKQFRCAYPHGFVPTIHRYRMGEYRDKKRQRNIFVGSMSDVFGEWVPDRWIREVFNACEKAPQHNYLFLTKNPGRYMELHHYGELPLRDNMWYGTTVTDPDTEYMGQDGHYEFHTFLSVEPILADFGELSEKSYIPEWIIVGAETDSRKDKVIPRREWIENIVEQCRKYNIPVFMKPSLTDIHKDHINSWHHDILRQGIAKIKHIVDHFAFLALDDSLFMSHIHNGTQFIFRDHIMLGIGIHMHQGQNA